MSEPNGNFNLDKGHLSEPARPSYPAGPAEPYGGYSTPGVQEPTNQSAILALVFGILGFVALGLFAAIPAVVFGNRAKREIATGGVAGGSSSTMATIGIVLGWIQIGLTAAGLLLLILIFGISAATHSY